MTQRRFKNSAELVESASLSLLMINDRGSLQLGKPQAQEVLRLAKVGLNAEIEASQPRSLESLIELEEDEAPVEQRMRHVVIAITLLMVGFLIGQVGG